MIDYDTGDAVEVHDAPAGGPTQVCLVDGGSLGDGDLGIFDSSSVIMNGGAVGDAVGAHGLSIFTMSGGSVPGGLYAYDSASVTMSGGLVDSTLFASGESSLVIEDGTLAASSIYARDSSSITIFGSGFEVDEAPVPFGDLTALRGTPGQVAPPAVEEAGDAEAGPGQQLHKVRTLEDRVGHCYLEAVRAHHPYGHSRPPTSGRQGAAQALLGAFGLGCRRPRPCCEIPCLYVVAGGHLWRGKFLLSGRGVVTAAAILVQGRWLQTWVESRL